ncbi:ATP-binding cassette domain-containing protein [Clostridium sp. MSJ-11]|uniref:ATP-binding cassette domain-containing protein n=1 Tax=Clostridium mobile TaxID=2841512 RepID=A0ABS6EIS8_9CLOT|nr:ATP-binding cassette domain-containing protein [Clostridium mobile]MBU5485123.1 ATP-binding cassette domain-containing protein [Clostridium mobile]
MGKEIISIKNVCKSFKEGDILKDISVEFEKGKIHGLIGRNGSGKTILLKCICGFVPVTSGEIFVNGKSIGKDKDVPDDVGIIIESPGFLPNYSGYNNLKFLAMINKKIEKENIEESIRKVGLDPRGKKWVSKYSLGMRQRLGIAQAIMESPSILILDEPMNGLDSSGVNDIRRLLQELRDEGRTILLASHMKEDIEMLCDRVCKMEAGRLTRIM